MGRTISPLILAIALEVGPRAVRFAERLLGDDALALDLFEEAAARKAKITVTRTEAEFQWRTEADEFFPNKSYRSPEQTRY